MGTDETSTSDFTASSVLRTIEEEELVTSLKVEELGPGGLKGTFSTLEIEEEGVELEIEEEGVESSDLSERGVKNKIILIYK